MMNLPAGRFGVLYPCPYMIMISKLFTGNHFFYVPMWFKPALWYHSKSFWPKKVETLFLHPIKAGLWCKGSTTDFDSVCLGSNPSNPTKGPGISGPFFI